MLEKILKIAISHPIVAIGSLSPLVPIILSFYYKKYFGKALKAITLFCVVFVLTDIPLWVTAGLKMSNIVYYSFRDSLIFALLVLVYAIGLRKNKFRQSIYWLTFSVMIVLMFCQFMPHALAANLLWISRLLTAFIAISYFYVLLADLKVNDILFFPFFWFNSGVLIYAISSIFISLFNHLTIGMDSAENDFRLFTNILELLNISLFLFISIAFVVSKRNFKSKIK